VPTGPQVQAAYDAKGFPGIAITSAPLEKSFVRLRTSFWLKPDAGGPAYRRIPVHVEVGTPGAANYQNINAVATPVGVLWEFGDDRTLTCDDVAMQVDEEGLSACSHVYEQSSAHLDGGEYKITASLTWTVHWECLGAGCDAPAGDLADHIEIGGLAFPVGEIQTEAQ